MPTPSSPGVTEIDTPSDLEARITRLVAAPRHLVWLAHTVPGHIQRWMLGPPGWTMPVCEMDLRPGGTWHWVWRKSAGEEMSMEGRYLEVVAGERIVSTEKWGPEWPETVNTIELTDHGQWTLITTTIRYPSKEARDAAMATGMTEGADQSYARLDELLRSLA